MGLLRLIHSAFDQIMSPWASLSPLWTLALFSLVTGLLMLLVFRYTSDQERIRVTKNGIKAHLLELWLFQNHPGIMLSAQARLLRLNGRYLRLGLKPMIIMSVPLAFLVISLDGWFGYRPLRPGEDVILSVEVRDGATGLLGSVLLHGRNGVAVETPPLRIAQAKEVDWRIRAGAPGIHTVSLESRDRRLEKQVVVGQGLARVSPSRLRPDFWQALLYPGEPPIPEYAQIERIDVGYPARLIRIFRWEVHWLVVFFAFSMGFALLFKRLLRVEL